MAKVTGQTTGERLNRRPSFKDRFYIREWRGKQIVQAKPMAGRKKLSEKQQIAVDKFQQAAVLAKLAAPSQQIEADVLTRDTQYFARDLLFMMMYGTFAHIELDNGRKIFSVASNHAVSELIDALAQTVGEMLFRNVDGWEGIAPGNPEDVLTFRDGRPIWAPSAGGGGGGTFGSLVSAITGYTTDNTQRAGAGIVIRPYQRLEVTRVHALLSRLLESYTYIGAIGRLDAFSHSATVIEPIAQSAPEALPSANYNLHPFVLTEPAELLPGEPYWFGVIEQSGGTLPRVPFPRSTSAAGIAQPQGPFDVLPGMAYVADRTLSIGTELDLGTETRYPSFWISGSATGDGGEE